MGQLDRRGRGCTRASRGAVGSLAILFLLIGGMAEAEEDLLDLSLEDLMNVEVTSASKKAQNRTDVAAAITVITTEDIRRGGFTSIPEALRIVPGVRVARIDANRWAIAIRGFTTEFSNKLLVMIDGRTVYTPLFGGVYWDIQDYPMEDIDRIEVIRGPGGTVWGANAVNGVVNVITKHARDTQGGLVSGYYGNRESGAGGRYGGEVGEKTQYRAFVRGFKVEDYDFDNSSRGDDEWHTIRGGLRVDHQATDRDAIRVSADFYNVEEQQGLNNGLGGFVPADFKARGGNVIVSWDRDLGDGETLATKAYYDRTYRDATSEEDRHIFDIEAIHDFSPIEDLGVTWGGTYRFSTSHFNSSPLTNIDPNDEDFHLASAFFQGQYDLFDGKLALIAGTKLGYNNFSGFEYQPSGRILAKPVEGHAIWAAVSRAVRTPTQTDRDLNTTFPSGLPFPPTITILGDRKQRSEDLLSFEAGYRFFEREDITFEVSAFYALYEDKSSIVAQGTPFLTPFVFSNEGEVGVRGLETELNWMPFEWWRLTAGYSIVRIDEDAPASPLSGGRLKESDPRHQFMLRTFFDLPADFEFDGALYFVDGLSGSVPTGRTDNVESYWRLDLRIGWRPVDWVELALVGQNLIDNRHAEFDDVQSNESSQVPRTGYGKVTFRF